MAIPQKIKQLTALALKDRIMTHIEKQTIVESAMNEGISEEEITDYLNKAYAERLKSYSKEELTHCPNCNAQVPLISDNCFYCGANLTVSSTASEEPQISGAEADIINEENKKSRRT